MGTFIRRLLSAIVLGAGMELGAYLLKQGVETATDPDKREAVKQKATDVKEVLFKKKDEEES